MSANRSRLRDVFDVRGVRVTDVTELSSSGTHFGAEDSDSGVNVAVDFEIQSVNPAGETRRIKSSAHVENSGPGGHLPRRERQGLRNGRERVMLSACCALWVSVRLADSGNLIVGVLERIGLRCRDRFSDPTSGPGDTGPSNQRKATCPARTGRPPVTGLSHVRPDWTCLYVQSQNRNSTRFPPAVNGGTPSLN